mmetsp:Transcript_21784/g.16127  ORF Transcript_21784/g.16127 Transcript_21784/m.16127 type:complete len:100 (-) Transcript_21784:427-726(-)
MNLPLIITLCIAAPCFCGLLGLFIYCVIIKTKRVEERGARYEEETERLNKNKVRSDDDPQKQKKEKKKKERRRSKRRNSDQEEEDEDEDDYEHPPREQR